MRVASGALNFALAVGDIDIVLIDSSVPGAITRRARSDDLAWLEAALGASSTTRPRCCSCIIRRS